MYQRKSTKGVRRGPYRKAKVGLAQYAAEVFTERLRELGVTLCKFAEDNEGKISYPTLSRIVNGSGGTSANSLGVVADMLGLEIIIRPKQTEENENQD